MPVLSSTCSWGAPRLRGLCHSFTNPSGKSSTSDPPMFAHTLSSTEHPCKPHSPENWPNAAYALCASHMRQSQHPAPPCKPTERAVRLGKPAERSQAPSWLAKRAAAKAQEFKKAPKGAEQSICRRFARPSAGAPPAQCRWGNARGGLANRLDQRLRAPFAPLAPAGQLFPPSSLSPNSGGSIRGFDCRSKPRWDHENPRRVGSASRAALFHACLQCL